MSAGLDGRYTSRESSGWDAFHARIRTHCPAHRAGTFRGCRHLEEPTRSISLKMNVRHPMSAYHARYFSRKRRLRCQPSLPVKKKPSRKFLNNVYIDGIPHLFITILGVILIRIRERLEPADFSRCQFPPFRAVHGDHGHGHQRGRIIQIAHTYPGSSERPQTLFQ